MVHQGGEEASAPLIPRRGRSINTVARRPPALLDHPGRNADVGFIHKVNDGTDGSTGPYTPVRLSFCADAHGLERAVLQRLPRSTAGCERTPA